MKAHVFGLETEYAVGHVAPDGARCLPARAVNKYLFSAIKKMYGRTSQDFDAVFLPNGGKFYPDMGHAEWASPECRCPLDLVAYDLAGDQILVESLPLAEESLRADGHTGEIFVIKNNVSASMRPGPVAGAAEPGAQLPPRDTYGCHENYLVPTRTRYVPDPEEFSFLLARHLVPFLVTRQILCGAGKVGYDDADVCEMTGYQISQRSDFINCVEGDSSTHDRPILHLKEEPLCDGSKYRRLHILLGDANRSPWSAFLKVSTTSLVLRCITENFLTEDLALANPVDAIRGISRDLTLQRTFGVAGDRDLRAIDIQRRFLSQAREFTSVSGSTEDRMAVRLWADTLDRLNEDPTLLRKHVDWVIKWQHLETLRRAKRWRWDDPRLEDAELSYHDVRPDKSLYHWLAAEGWIEPFPWPELLAAVAYGQRNPPVDTRAFLRGLAVGDGAKVSWDSIDFGSTGSTFHLDDPLMFDHPELLAKLPRNDVLAGLRRALRSSCRVARVRAARALREAGDRNAIPLLLDLYCESDLPTRTAAGKALDKFFSGPSGNE